MISFVNLLETGILWSLPSLNDMDAEIVEFNVSEHSKVLRQKNNGTKIFLEQPSLEE